MLVLPVFQVPCFSYRISLDGAEYKLRFRWQDRTSSWYFDLWSASGVPLISGRRVGVNWPLDFGKRSELIYPGSIMPIQTAPLTGAMSDLWSCCALCYYSAGEFVSNIVRESVSVELPS